MARYAANTTVGQDQSEAEIKRTLRRYGADQLLVGEAGRQHYLAFRLRGRCYRLQVTMPERAAREFTHTPGRGLERTPEQALAAWEQACRQRWRALALVILAKLEAVEAGITSMEQEFLPAMVLPDGRTFAEWAEPQLAAIADSGRMPTLLLPASSGGAQ